MQLYKISNGYLRENTYLIGTNDCYVIDPGEYGVGIIKKIKDNFNSVKGILLTHGHFDHCYSVDLLVETFNCPVYMSLKDKCFIDGSLRNDNRMKGCLIELKSTIRDINELKDNNIVVLETPGHTIGSVCYLFKKENILFSGDTLFNGDTGRIDLPTGSRDNMINSLRYLKTLDDNIVVYPGHEEETTIGNEKENNYVLRRL